MGNIVSEVRNRNEITRILVGVYDSSDNLVTTGILSATTSGWNDGSNPAPFAATTNAPTFISGYVNLVTTAAEMNYDYVAFHITSDAVGAKPTLVLVNTSLVHWAVLGTAVYKSASDDLTINAYLERFGQRVIADGSATCDIFDEDGVQVGTQLTDAVADAQGQFKFNQAATPIVADRTYVAVVAITHKGVVHTGYIGLATSD